MRIQRLSLDFFGQFTGKVLDFGEADRPSDFHVIYGANEAGKTTLMEGFLRLLFGFPHIESYDFRHQRKNLQVSGILDLNGEKRDFTRLPKKTGNLLDGDGIALPGHAISAHLGGLSLEDYRSLLCLDDDTIEKGGEEIANARGDIGRLLFSAAAGVSDLNAVLDEAREEIDGLYRKRASTTRLAELKRELGEVERRIREMDVSARAWHRLKQTLRSAEDEEEKARGARDELRVSQAQTAALSRALPNLGERDRLVEESVDYIGYPKRLDINPEDLVALKTDYGKAEAEILRLREEIREAREERDGITLDDERLALTETLDALDVLHSRMKTAALDLPRRRRELKDAETDIARMAADLGVPKGIELTRLIRSPAEIAALEKARDAMREAAGKSDAEAGEVASLEARILEAKKTHEALQARSPSQTGFIELLSRFDADTLAPQEAKARQAIAMSDERLGEALGALSIGGCRFTTVPDCPIDQTGADELAARHAKLMERIERVEETLARHREDIDVTTARIACLTESVGVAGDDEARQARGERDERWRAHRETLTAESADVFELSMKRVDDIEGSRLAHASEIGELRQLEQARVEARTRSARTSASLGGLRDQVTRIEGEVERVAQSIGLPALSPASLQVWVKMRIQAAAAQRKKDQLTERHRPVLDQAGRLREALRPMLLLEEPTIDAALAAARRLADAERIHQDDLKSGAETLASLEEQLESRQSRLAELNRTAKSVSDEWATQVLELFGDGLDPEILAGALGQLRDIRTCDAKRLQVKRQVSSMEEDQGQFAEAMKPLRERHDLPSDDPLEVFRLLRGIAKQAEADRARHAGLCRRIEEEIRRLRAVEAHLEEIDRQVYGYGALFPETAETGTLDSLRIVVGKAQENIRTRSRIASLERQILAELSVPNMTEARALLDGVTAPILEARSRALEADLRSAETQLSDATVLRANAERDLYAVRGDAEVAALVEQRTTLQMQIEDTVLEYLERDFGLRLAEEAIRRYRDRHRSGMMEATERAFSGLTNGAYGRLQTQPDGSSEILLAVDANGVPKQVGDMSKGTRFQLYLALRAAAYEQMVSQGVRLPFFCDDVFETFDEDRTRAACRLMERIGRSGQAIYLTHHRHVVEIAEEVCDVQPVTHML